MAINYIKGKRIKYYNFFYLFLLVLGANVLVSYLFNNWYDIKPVPVKATTDKDTLDITAFVGANFKILLFLFIPFFALNGLLLFRRIKLNFAEHAVIAGIILLTNAAWYFVLNLHFYITYYSSLKLFEITGMILFFIMLLIPVQVYRQATGKHYKLAGFAWRILLWYLLLFAEAFILAVILYIITGKTSVTIN